MPKKKPGPGKAKGGGQGRASTPKKPGLGKAYGPGKGSVPKQPRTPGVARSVPRQPKPVGGGVGVSKPRGSVPRQPKPVGPITAKPVVRAVPRQPKPVGPGIAKPKPIVGRTNPGQGVQFKPPGGIQKPPGLGNLGPIKKKRP